LLPAGLDPAGFVGGLPQTATPWPLLAVIGAALLALAGWMRPPRRAFGEIAQAAPLALLADLARRVC
jgi:LPXTG-motif cell wall-anchored protein